MCLLIARDAAKTSRFYSQHRETFFLLSQASLFQKVISFVCFSSHHSYIAQKNDSFKHPNWTFIQNNADGSRRTISHTFYLSYPPKHTSRPFDISAAWWWEQLKHSLQCTLYSRALSAPQLALPLSHMVCCEQMWHLTLHWIAPHLFLDISPVFICHSGFRVLPWPCWFTDS